jgi:Protein of unknown function (DUF3108)
MRLRIFNILIVLAFSVPAWAEEPPPLNLKGTYEFQFSGLPIGKMGIEVEQDASHYAMTSDVVATGVVKLFTQHMSHTTAQASGGRIAYDTHYQTKKKPKSAHLVYTAGKLVEENVQPPDNRAVRPAVPDELKNRAHDLLSFNLALRGLVWKALHAGTKKFSLTAYDGRRLTEVDGTVEGKRVIDYGGKPNFPVIAVSLKRKQLAGFTPPEIEGFDSNEPPLTLYYSDDSRFVPVKLEVMVLFGKITGTLAKECRSGESCLLGLKE